MITIIIIIIIKMAVIATPGTPTTAKIKTRKTTTLFRTDTISGSIVCVYIPIWAETSRYVTHRRTSPDMDSIPRPGNLTYTALVTTNYGWVITSRRRYGPDWSDSPVSYTSSVYIINVAMVTPPLEILRINKHSQ